jgi:hypothetical protein
LSQASRAGGGPFAGSPAALAPEDDEQRKVRFMALWQITNHESHESSSWKEVRKTVVGNQAHSQRAVDEQSWGALRAEPPREQRADRAAEQNGKNDLEDLGHGFI